jgi:phage terminase Nu1 subunit (DNA packaging protein)
VAKKQRKQKQRRDRADPLIKRIAKALKISTVQVWRLSKRGMPLDEARARAWRDENIQTKTGAVASEVGRLRAAQARIAEMEARQLASELVELAEVELSITEAMVLIRSTLDGVASRCAPQLATMTEAAEIRLYLLNEIRDALRSAADRLEARWRMAAGNEIAPAQADPKPVEVGRRKPRAPRRKR